MPSQVATLLEREVVSVDSYGKGIDLGAHRYLETQTIVHSVGGASAGVINLQHSAVDEHQTYTNLTSNVALAATSNSLESEANFLRYVRWHVDDNLDGSPVVSIYIVAKE